MVELLDPTSGAVIPGYEASRCVLQNVDGTRLPLVWSGDGGEAGLGAEGLAGKRVQARLHIRRATVFALVA